jgi:hypothetical protein
MFQGLRPMLRHRAPVLAALSETELPTGRGIAAGLRAAPAISNGRSPRTGWHCRIAAQSRAAADHFSSNQFRGIQS